MASKKIYRSRGYLDQILFTGAIVHGARLSSPEGWVRLSGLTIGSSTSGATERANDDCEDLFKLLWNECTDTECPVISGRGASADADWAANKQLTLWDCRNEVFAGLDYDTGFGFASKLTTSGCGIDGRILGGSGGSEVHLLTGSESGTNTHLHPHTFTITQGAKTGGITSSGAHSHSEIKCEGMIVVNQGGSGVKTWNYSTVGQSGPWYTNSSSYWATTTGSAHTHTNNISFGNPNLNGSISNSSQSNASSSHNNTQPTRIVNVFIKL